MILDFRREKYLYTINRQIPWIFLRAVHKEALYEQLGGRFREFDSSLFTSVHLREIQDRTSLLDESYSPFHVEFEMSSEFDFGDFIPHNDRCLVNDHP
jgi:hypothetical protein